MAHVFARARGLTGMAPDPDNLGVPIKVARHSWLSGGDQSMLGSTVRGAICTRMTSTHLQVVEMRPLDYRYQ